MSPQMDEGQVDRDCGGKEFHAMPCHGLAVGLWTAITAHKTLCRLKTCLLKSAIPLGARSLLCNAGNCRVNRNTIAISVSPGDGSKGAGAFLLRTRGFDFEEPADAEGGSSADAGGAVCKEQAAALPRARSAAPPSI
ncbi:uncharacterized protein [Triticum aestivum]|uniref:uncharacterized protein isoform X4 n=1 Tax=Triticum aestivum TaxID=4565 RepID=UPI001D02339E|nr:uncharacterized protein LOC123123634 isoform X4 [Triticum aestivum]